MAISPNMEETGLDICTEEETIVVSFAIKKKNKGDIFASTMRSSTPPKLKRREIVSSKS